MIKLTSIYKNAIPVVATIAVYTYSGPTHAELEMNFSGFGTLGYAISTESYAYDTHIDNDGTFASDSLVAGQLDLQMNAQWSATVQAQYAPDDSSDSGWEPGIAWAFLSYRPSSDWLIRGGKLRIPGYLNSENRNVGITYDYVRVPIEFDSVTQTYDFTGASIQKTVLLDESEILFNLYYGESDMDWRKYIRDSGSIYVPVNIELLGAAVTYQTTDNIYLAAIHSATINNESDYNLIKSPVYTNGGYYSISPDDGVVVVDSYKVYIVNAGFDVLIGNDTRIAAEAGIRHAAGLTSGVNSAFGYVSLRKQINEWTPYLLYSQIKTDSEDLAFYHSVNSTTVASEYQRAIADSLQAFDQYSVALGTSYSFSPVSKLKAEIMLTHINSASSLIDAPEGSNINNTDIGVFTVTYSFAF